LVSCEPDRLFSLVLMVSFCFVYFILCWFVGLLVFISRTVRFPNRTLGLVGIVVTPEAPPQYQR